MTPIWNKYPDVRPTEYGKYEVYRAGCGKQHYETWNNTGWAYNNNDITHWREIVSPLSQPTPTDQELQAAILAGVEHGQSIMAYYQMNGWGEAPLTPEAFAKNYINGRKKSLEIK